MRNSIKWLTVPVMGCLSLTACQETTTTKQTSKTVEAVSAFGAPGDKSTWAYSGKTGIGTSYEQYFNWASDKFPPKSELSC